MNLIEAIISVKKEGEHDGFHCGEGLEVMVDGKWVQTRMEKSWDENGGKWYLVGTPYEGDLEYILAKI